MKIENLARETAIKSLCVVKLPGVENLPTVIVLGEMHVLPTTLRSTAGRVNPLTNFLPLGTNHTILFLIQKNWGVFHIKPSLGWLRMHTSLGRGLVRRGKITDVSNQLFPETLKIIFGWALKLFIIREPPLLF